MKPSEKIVKRARELIKQDYKGKHPYENWETIESQTDLIMQLADMEAYVLQAILDYLDESTHPVEEEKK